VGNAADGTLTIYLGGSDQAFARWADVLAPLGTPVHLGPTGAGAAMKLVANSALAGVMGVIGEALALADGLGLDQQKVIAALLESPVGPALARKRDQIAADHYPRGFRLSLMLKDVRLVLDAAARRGVELRLAGQAEQWIAQAQRHGLGDHDYSAVVAEIRGRPATR
jgi:3-hydroxyisobutyrate dehydrogenase/2-hydroxy-3-oxopropionate reductase